MTFYLVRALRWGWFNAHSYFVYGGPDKSKALAMAKSECSDRGGKYGCAVYEFSESGENETLIAYESSSYNEVRPYENHRTNMLNSMGLVLEAFAEGTVYLPKVDEELGRNILVPVKVTPPEWLLEEVKRRRESMEAFVKNQELLGVGPK